jgi:hypothetical protein
VTLKISSYSLVERKEHTTVSATLAGSTILEIFAWWHR